MSNARLVHDADKAANEALQLLSSLESVYRDLECNVLCIAIVHSSFCHFDTFSFFVIACPCKLSRNSDYVSYDAMHGSILPEGDDQNDVVKQRVDCVNVAIFTNAMWSNSVQYNEAIPIFFPLLIPKHLHDREGIVGLFLDMVTLWAFTETRWPIGKLTLRHVISKVEGKIEVVLKDEDPLLCQKIWATFHARYDHVRCYAIAEIQIECFSSHCLLLAGSVVMRSSGRHTQSETPQGGMVQSITHRTGSH